MVAIIAVCFYAFAMFSFGVLVFAALSAERRPLPVGRSRLRVLCVLVSGLAGAFVCVLLGLGMRGNVVGEAILASPIPGIVAWAVIGFSWSVAVALRFGRERTWIVALLFLAAASVAGFVFGTSGVRDPLEFQLSEPKALEDGETFGSGNRSGAAEYVVLTITNRGDRAVLLEHLSVATAMEGNVWSWYGLGVRENRNRLTNSLLQRILEPHNTMQFMVQAVEDNGAWRFSLTFLTEENVIERLRGVLAEPAPGRSLQTRLRGVVHRRFGYGSNAVRFFRREGVNTVELDLSPNATPGKVLEVLRVEQGDAK